ncbi:MAG: chemotaxis protein CheC [Gammaproteobacteria bacterium]|jgi:chemotaxis protein CheC|nr:chemotaxis protein CheC [Gammaproteobacteria bacterium]MBT3724034.1 chemotaxis protein CheC [Gammaproteobacteria bacterium]MBT4076634.1 chemotaxis protein CheC [Gammaproteobacteria bacterium]MBT4194374.1 chemotaxis protein CheC [Gammaproteobacteria bacterium]MBT4451199.1 chemotaxis protein CheC [Gammaproteobacteria bacterium]
MASKIDLTELEADLLAELFNIGVGRAADSLSRMVNQEVKLSVPSVEFRSVREMADYLGGDNIICSVSQNMTGEFDARSMLLFPEDNSMEVVRLLMGDHLSDELVADMQEEALNEIGNIVLNACIGSIATTLDKQFDVGLPEFEADIPMNLLSSSVSSEADGVLLIRINMDLSESNVKGYLAFLLGPASQENLRRSLKTLLEKFGA